MNLALLLFAHHPLNRKHRLKLEISIKMSNQPVTGISKLAIMENISSNHLSIVSMLVGINCRLNAQDAILREIKEKLCGVNGDGSSETSDDDNNQGENEEEEERKLKIMAQLANDRFVPWVTLTENSKVQEENSPKEMATEIDEKGKRS